MPNADRVKNKAALCANTGRPLTVTQSLEDRALAVNQHITHPHTCGKKNPAPEVSDTWQPIGMLAKDFKPWVDNAAGQFPIVPDYEAGVVRVGQAEYDCLIYKAGENERHFRILALERNDACTDAMLEWPNKKWHQYSAKILGPKFNSRLRAATFHLYVSSWAPRGIWRFLHTPDRHWRKTNGRLVDLAYKHQEKVLQAHRDGIGNIIPFIILTGMDPSELKRHYGTGLWKRLAANSVTRNRLIAHHSRAIGPDVEHLQAMRSGHLVVAGSAGFCSAAAHADRLLPKIDKNAFRHLGHTIRDCMRMDAYNPRWGVARLMREHDEAVAARARGEYSDRRFADDLVGEVDGYTFTLLTSQAAIAHEGRAMHHCVSVYAGDAAQSGYLVFTVEGQGERATLGAFPGIMRPELDQLYGACNSRVSNECTAAARKFLSSVNEEDVVALFNVRDAA